MERKKSRTSCLILFCSFWFCGPACPKTPRPFICVPVDTLSVDSTSRTQISSKNFLIKSIWGSGDEQLNLQSKHYLGYNYKVGFRSCESLGAEINKNMYIRGKVSLGGILRLGPWQMTISVQNRILSIASEVDLRQLNELCYNGDKNRHYNFSCKWSLISP